MRTTSGSLSVFEKQWGCAGRDRQRDGDILPPERPAESGTALLTVAAGVPAYYFFKALPRNEKTNDKPIS